MKYIGDGDTEAFSKVVESKPYGEVEIEKLECVGHVQKRLGTRLRNIRKDMKGQVLTDGKKIAGRGRLTDKCINTLQNYYGMAIRQNKDDLYGMKKAVGAVLFHCSDIADDNIRHKFCPRIVNGWCKWQHDKLTGESTYKKKLNLPLVIKTVIEPIFRDLSDEKLLSKCLHGQTQNANEAYNAIIWNRCPKTVFVNRTVLELSVFSATISFNDGFKGLSTVFSKLGFVDPGHYYVVGSIQKDNKRIRQCKRQSSDESKKRRKQLWAIKKGYLDRDREIEGGVSYAAGNATF